MTQKIAATIGVKTVDYGGAHNLLCPRCGGEYLHQYAVTIYERGEDGNTEIRTHVEKGASKTEVVPASSDNPSSRRQGMTISFSCEACPDSEQAIPIQLTISQHKGNTEIGWRHAPRKTKIA